MLEGERAGRVVQALTHLPEPQRRVLELAYYKGLTQSEIAQREGMPLGTVKTRTQLAMKKLRQELASEIEQLL